MITKNVDRKLKWIDVQKEICNEDYTKTIYIFGIRIHKYTFKVTHEIGTDSKIGFGTKNSG